MTPNVMFVLECLQLGISLAAFGLSLLVLRGAWSDWQDAKAAGEGITAQANEIARERLITAMFLAWIAMFLAISGFYAVALVRSSTITAHWFGTEWLQTQALVLRVIWRSSVLGFAFVRWSVRERIRRPLELD
jgi:hypothetical protein